MKYKLKKNKKASVSVYMLGVGVILTILGTGMLAVGYHARVRAIRNANQIIARSAADAGIIKASHLLKKAKKQQKLNTLPINATFQLPDSDCSCTYSILNDSGSYTITSTGYYSTAQVTTETTYQLVGMPYEYAVYSLDGIELKNSALIDWYNYQDDEEPLKVGTDSTDSGSIDMKNSSYINGDVIVGAGGDISKVIKQTGGTYSGDAYAQSSTYSPDMVTVPQYLSDSPTSGEIKKKSTLTSSGKYSKIDLGNKETLVIEGNVELYVTGKVTLGNGSEILVTEGSSLSLYMDGDLEAKNGSSLNNLTEDPIKFKILGTSSSDEVVLKNSTNSYAVIYAPTAKVKVHNSATVYGAVISKETEIKNSGKVYYDASLRKTKDPAIPRLELVRWQEY